MIGAPLEARLLRKTVLSDIPVVAQARALCRFEDDADIPVGLDGPEVVRRIPMREIDDKWVHCHERLFPVCLKEEETRFRILSAGQRDSGAPSCDGSQFHWK
jgi:hypothetical protein